MVWLKSLHISALVIWGAMLLYMPVLLASHARASGSEDEFRRLRILSRSSFIFVSSPAAVIAIASGTALIFVNEVYEGWMFLKLGGVGALALLHAWKGGLLTAMHDPSFGISWRRFAFLASANVAVIGVILALVLGKPRIDQSILPEWFLRPYGLL